MHKLTCLPTCSTTPPACESKGKRALRTSCAPTFLLKCIAQSNLGQVAQSWQELYIQSGELRGNNPKNDPCPARRGEWHQLATCQCGCLCRSLPLLTTLLPPLMPSLSLWDCKLVLDLRPPLPGSNSLHGLTSYPTTTSSILMFMFTFLFSSSFSFP